MEGGQEILDIVLYDFKVGVKSVVRKKFRIFVFTYLFTI